MSKFIEALKQSSQEIESRFNQSNLFEHNGEKGEFREEIISELLRPFLPECYGLGTGQVFSLDDQMSRQIDIVIYDAVYSNVLFRNKSSSLFPCESVFGEIEVKSNLTSDELERSIENIKSLKKLNRAPSSMLDITPIYELKIGSGLTCDQSKRYNDYIGVIFGFNGAEYDTLGNILDKQISEGCKEYLPDFIFNYRKRYFLMKLDDNGKFAGINSDFKEYGVVFTDDIIPVMFLILNTLLNQIRLKSPDYNQYLLNVLKNI